MPTTTDPLPAPERDTMSVPAPSTTVPEPSAGPPPPVARETLPAEQVAARMSEDTTTPLLLENKRIIGTLDLQMRTIKRPLLVANCDFEGQFDVRNAEFEGTVSF